MIRECTDDMTNVYKIQDKKLKITSLFWRDGSSGRVSVSQA
jgi:hypothetical protein